MCAGVVATPVAGENRRDAHDLTCCRGVAGTRRVDGPGEAERFMALGSGARQHARAQAACYASSSDDGGSKSISHSLSFASGMKNVSAEGVSFLARMRSN